MARTSATQRKALKGTVAAATGVALLLGGAGTWAWWTATVDGMTPPELEVTAGDLQARFGDDWEGDASWTYVNSELAAGTDADYIVPGDELTRVDTGTIVVYGNGDVEFKVDATYSTIGAPKWIGESGGANPYLSSTSTVEVMQVPDADDTPTKAIPDENGYEWSRTVEVKVTTNLTYSKFGYDDEQGETFTVAELGSPTITVTQTGTTSGGDFTG